MKNFYALNPGEFFVGQELAKRRKNLRLYFPLNDSGIDLLALKEGFPRPVSIQVKESRIYSRGNSWHQVKKNKLEEADIFIFVTYRQKKSQGKETFDKDYVVIPRQNLLDICRSKKPSGGKYSFYLVSRKNQVLDVRDKQIDLSPYHNAWNLIDSALNNANSD